MITENPYNHRKQEFSKYTDVLEDLIRPRNTSPLELRLLKQHNGKQRRQRNNHAERLAKWRTNNH